jgi:hypothetical protein
VRALEHLARAADLELVTCALDNPRNPGEQDIVKGS